MLDMNWSISMHTNMICHTVRCVKWTNTVEQDTMNGTKYNSVNHILLSVLVPSHNEKPLTVYKRSGHILTFQNLWTMCLVGDVFGVVILSVVCYAASLST